MQRRSFLGVAAGAGLAAVGSIGRAEGAAFRLAPSTTQATVGLADGWGSTSVRLQRWERKAGSPWQPVGGAWQGRLGGAGLVWGRGLSPTPRGAALKVEGDKRAPAGVFGLGTACGYDRDIVRHAAMPYFQVTSRDLWFEDPDSPHYNRHLRLDREPRAGWEKKAQMRQGDYAHSLKLFIMHNAPPRVVPGGGSSIFFHIWRAGGTKASIGCTTMDEPKLRELIAWLDPRRLPVYILLPRAEYEARRVAWGLPI
jgi:L,D-peptidoglycan transpeptidase YkuD (ErfK/YbiS/YcfS/YnhG family)